MSKDKLELKGSLRFVMLNILRVNPTSGISTHPGREHDWLLINLASCCATDQEGPEQEARARFDSVRDPACIVDGGDVLTACYPAPARDLQPWQICHWSPNLGHQSLKINKDFHCHSSNLDVWFTFVSVLYYYWTELCKWLLLLRAGDLVEKLKFFSSLPHTQIAAIICTDQVGNTLLRKRSYISCTICTK